MPTKYTYKCPVDGCNYTTDEEKRLESHIGSQMDSNRHRGRMQQAHDWENIDVTPETLDECREEVSESSLLDF